MKPKSFLKYIYIRYLTCSGVIFACSVLSPSNLPRLLSNCWAACLKNSSDHSVSAGTSWLSVLSSSFFVSEDLLSGSLEKSPRAPKHRLNKQSKKNKPRKLCSYCLINPITPYRSPFLFLYLYPFHRSLYKKKNYTIAKINTENYSSIA